MFKATDFVRNLWNRITGKAALLYDLERAWDDVDEARNDCNVFQKVINEQVKLILQLSSDLDDHIHEFATAQRLIAIDRDQWRAGAEYYEQFFIAPDAEALERADMDIEDLIGFCDTVLVDGDDWN